MENTKEIELFRKLLADFFDNNNYGLHIFQLENFDDDTSLRLVATNKIANKITGINPELVIGSKILETVPNLEEQNIHHIFADAVREKKIVDLGEVSYKDKRMVLKIYNVKAYPQIGDHLLVSFIDVTERKDLENKIKRVEKKYEALINSGNVLIWVSDKSGGIDFLNKVWEKFTGKSISNLYSEDWQSYLHHDDIIKEQKLFYKCLKKKTSYFNYFRLRNKKNEYRWIYEEVTPRFDDNQFVGLVGHCIDVNERMLFEEALLNEKKLLRTLIDNLPDAIFVKDRQGRKIISNRADVQNLGFNKEEEVLGKTDLDLFVPEFAQKCYEDDMQVIRFGKSIINRDEKISNDDNTFKWLRTTKIPYYDAEDKIAGLIGIAHDISKRKEMETALRESEARYKKIFEFHSAIKLLINCDTNEIIDANRAAIKFYGYSKKKLLTMNYAEILDNSVNGKIQENNLDETLDHIETRHILADQSLKDVEIYSSNISVLGNMYSHLIIHDITDRKILESQLVQAQKLESIGQLAAGIAHEINTPTQYVGDNISFLQDAFDTILKVGSIFENTLTALKAKSACEKEYKNLVDSINDLDLEFLISEVPEAIKQSKEGIDRITKIVKAMKGFSHPVMENKVVSNLNDLIENTVIISKNEWKYQSVLETNYTDQACNIYCFPNELSQVILNMIVNAAHAIEQKFTDNSVSGKIIITTIAQKKSVQVTISDNGAGIPEKIKKLVFNHFFTTKPVGKGTGQGLAIAYDIIVNKHNGKIDFNSVEGEGTTFTISLPYE